MARRKSAKPAAWVTKRGKKFVLRWIDPLDPEGKRICQESTDTTRRRDAERMVPAKIKELEDLQNACREGWAEFRDRYELERLSGLAGNSMRVWRAACNHFERIIAPRVIADASPSNISRFQHELRKMGRREDTIASYLRTLRAALSWAHKLGLIEDPPHVVMPSRVRGSKMMKGRPITTEEFERMLMVVPSVLRRKARREVPNHIVQCWFRILRGLWLSGLRLEEAVALHWDRPDRLHIHKIDCRRPMMRIHAQLEKGKQDRLLPITPDFVAFLRETPPASRTGKVFEPTGVRGEILTSNSRISEYITEFGSAANVVVDVDPVSSKVKYASAHDLRRSFGERWSSRVMPAVLKELMRHKSIETTMKYYVGINAQRTADAVWEASMTRDCDIYSDITPEQPTQ